MKNIIYLFALVGFLSCSNDDEDANPFFTEYDGIVWLQDSETESGNIVINKANNSVRYFYEIFGDCGRLDVMNEFHELGGDDIGYTPRIISETINKLEYEWTGNGWDGTIIKLEVSDNVLTLTTGSERTYLRTNDNPPPCD